MQTTVLIGLCKDGGVRWHIHTELVSVDLFVVAGWVFQVCGDGMQVSVGRRFVASGKRET